MGMEKTIKERVMEFIKFKKISVKEFENRCGLSNGYIGSMRKGFGPGKLNNVLTAFPELNRDWLLYGEGEMVSSPPPSVVDTRPHVDQYAAGGGNEVLDGVTLAQCEQVPVIPMIPNYTFTIRVTGESMSPYINPGDVVACLKIDESSFMQWGHIYVLFTSQGIIVKRVFDAGDGIRCVSINESYQDFIIPKSEIYSFNLVIGLVRICN